MGKIADRFAFKNVKKELHTLHIQAIRHLKVGTFEMLAFSVEIEQDLKFSKSQLLGAICDTQWGLHQEACAAAIAQYFLLTDSFKEISKVMKPYGYEINFYETGAQKDRAGNEYGCREILGIGSKDVFDSMVAFRQTSA